jgi:manganese-dependent inorganic pyrophosphatase
MFPLSAVALLLACEIAQTDESSHSKDDCKPQPAIDIDSNDEFLMPRLPPLHNFENVVFCGHLVPDSDSVASAIAGALIFRGVAAITAPPNPETKYLLDRFKIVTPALVADVYTKGQGFVLVDHNVQAQMHPVLLDDSDNLRGIIDHHPLTPTSAAMSTATYVETQSWGCGTTILATKFLQYSLPLSPDVAGLMLGAIISDTLNFRASTTTKQDMQISGWLARQVNWPNKKHSKHFDYSAAVLDLASEQFKAKSNLTDMTTREIMLLDFKQQPMPNGDIVGWGQCETMDPFYSNYLETSSLLDFVAEMRAYKHQKSPLHTGILDYMFVSFVDIWSAQLGKESRSTVVCISEKECDVLVKAFPDAAVTPIEGSDEGASIVDTSPMTSRKNEFIPAVSAVLT